MSEQAKYAVGDRLHFRPSPTRAPFGTVISEGAVTVTEVVDHGSATAYSPRFTYVVQAADGETQGTDDRELVEATTSEKITPTSPLELIELLGKLVSDAVDYEGKTRDLTNLRKVWQLNKAGDPNWTEFLSLWASQTPASRCASVATDILKYAGEQAQAVRNFREHQSAKRRVTEDGMYRNPATGEIFKVQWNRGEGDGARLYAKQMVAYAPDGERVIQFVLEGERIEGLEVSFVYVRGGVYQIDPAWKMSLEQAKQFGALYGTCIRCGRTLTREDSIERMMGSTCAKKF